MASQPKDKNAKPVTARATNSSIRGERIAAEARKCVFKQQTLVKGVLKKGCLLKKNATCVVVRPLEAKPKPAVPKSDVPLHTCIKGEVIVGEAKSIEFTGVTMGSHTHNIQKYTLSGDCYCVISRPLQGLHQ